MMHRGHLLVVLIGVMLVMMLTAQNLKKLTPLLTSASAAHARGPVAAPPTQALLNQLALQDSAADQAAFQKAWESITHAPVTRMQAAPRNPVAQNTPDGDFTRLKNRIASALAQAKQKILSVSANPPETHAEEALSNPAPDKKPILKIYPQVSAEITNPHFTARQLRRARRMMRELRQNNEDTAAAIRQQYGEQAAEEAKKIALRTETQAEEHAQTAQTWEAFETAFEKAYTQGENKLAALIKKYIK